MCLVFTVTAYMVTKKKPQPKYVNFYKEKTSKFPGRTFNGNPRLKNDFNGGFPPLYPKMVLELDNSLVF